MFFVTIKRPEYVLFTMSQSERFALGLTEQRVVRLFGRGPGGDWQLLREWDGNKYSHTEFMTSLHRLEEPSDPAALLALVPAGV